MDLIRAAISGLIYSSRIEKIAEYVSEPDRQRELLSYLTEIVKFEEISFTKSDLQSLSEIISKEWSVSEELGITWKDRDFIYRFPVLLSKFGDKVLLYNGLQDPKVVFTDLLRWRELSLLVSEDLLTISWLAARDVINRKERKYFLWPNILEHDNFRINAILERELSDTHCHINAATDVFEFNWLRLMNYPEKQKSINGRRKSSGWTDGEQHDYDPVNRYSKINLSLAEWIIVASAIRVFLFKRGNPRIGIKQIVEMFRNSVFDYSSLSALREELIPAQFTALKTQNGIIPDYAIRASDFRSGIPSSPYMIHHGERSFLYNWFHGYFSGEKERITEAPLMLLYLVIKSHVRREFVQTNPLLGFKNFQDYDHLRGEFIPESGKNASSIYNWEGNRYWENLLRYAVQTSLEGSSNRFLEARITPNDIGYYLRMNYRKSIFSKTDYLGQEEGGNVSFVVHFIKTPVEKGNGMTSRHAKARRSLAGQVRLVLRWHLQEEVPGIPSPRTSVSKNDSYSPGEKFTLEELPKITGIDAAGSELNSRPEVFAPYFRFLGEHEIRNFTFHAGEDFYDIVDGLRTMDEAYDFMNLGCGCRIGHGLALGLDPVAYYRERHRILIIPRQILLDNCVWLYYTSLQNNIRLNPKTLKFIEESFNRLTGELGYKKVFQNLSLFDYYKSMLLRGDYIEETPGDTLISDRIRHSSVSPMRENLESDYLEGLRRLWNHYEFDVDCRTRGNEVTTIEMHKEYPEDIIAVQEAMMTKLGKKGIVIETNPSSNYKIGRFHRYADHPIRRFHSVDSREGRHALVVSINTDDKGIFATSLKNEYSLIAAALRKEKDSEGNMRWTDLQIEEYIRRIAHYGNITRFR